MASIEIDAPSLMHSVTVEVRFRRFRNLRARIFTALLLLRLVDKIAPFQLSVITPSPKNPWLFYCPYCDRETCGEILGPLFTQICNHCNRTFLAIAPDDESTARAVRDPDCPNECGYHEPLGWVISEDCPLHNDIPGAGYD